MAAPPCLLPTAETWRHTRSPTLRRSRLCPYSSKMVVPLCITPFPVIIQVPSRTRRGRGPEGEARTPCLYRAVLIVFPEDISPTCLFSDNRLSSQSRARKLCSFQASHRLCPHGTPQPLDQSSQVGQVKKGMENMCQGYGINLLPRILSRTCSS